MNPQLRARFTAYPASMHDKPAPRDVPHCVSAEHPRRTCSRKPDSVRIRHTHATNTRYTLTEALTATLSLRFPLDVRETELRGIGDGMDNFVRYVENHSLSAQNTGVWWFSDHPRSALPTTIQQGNVRTHMKGCSKKRSERGRVGVKRHTDELKEKVCRS